VLDEEVWMVFCDGSWGTFDAGVAVFLISLSKIKTSYATRLDFQCTNNIAKYNAVLMGLRKLKAVGVRRKILKSDSQVITRHVDKSNKSRDSKLEKYVVIVRRTEASIEGFSVKTIQEGITNKQIC
jgi:ribonuclease HI